MERHHTSNGLFYKVRDNFGIIKDIFIVAGIVFAMYLQGHYVTIEKFEASSKENETAHAALTATMTSIDKTLALMSRTQSDLTELQAQMKIHTIAITELSAQNKIDAEYNNLFKESADKISNLQGRVSTIESLELQKFKAESAINRAQMDVRIKSLEETRTTQAK